MHLKSHRRCLVNWALILSLGWLIVASLFLPALVKGQEDDSGWSAPELVVYTTGRLTESAMALVADSAGGLHLFFPHKLDETSLISVDYVSWDGSAWSQPVDVLVTGQSGGAPLVRAAIDSRQVIHLLWFDSGSTLMHASAEAAQVGSPRAWSSPHKLAKRLLSGDIAVGPDDTLYVVYGDPSLTDTVSLVTSTDGGANWSEPRPVASSGSGEVGIGEISADVDEAGRLHMVWGEYELPDGWPPAGVFYARSNTETGESPILLQIAGEGYGEAGVVTVGEDEVHLVWSSTVTGDGAYHSRSLDGGESWAAPDIYERGSGFSGQPSFAIDSAGALHYILGGARTASWQDGVLSPYVHVAGEDLATGTNQAEGWSPPERAEMTITTGNRLHVVFETGFQKLWHTSKTLDAPPLPTVELPESTVTSTPQPVTPQPEVTVAPDATRVVVTAPLGGSSPSTDAPLRAVIAGVVAAGVVVFAALAWNQRR
ncbi:sialidase family protein [Chloroflexota bacterium]